MKLKLRTLVTTHTKKYGYYTVFLPMQSSRDTAIMQNIKRKMKHESAIIKKRYSVEGMLSIIKCFDILSVCDFIH